MAEDIVMKETLMRHEQEIGILKGALIEIKDNTAEIKNFMGEIVETNKQLVLLQAKTNELETLHNQNHSGTQNAHERIDDILKDETLYRTKTATRFTAIENQLEVGKPIINVLIDIKENLFKYFLYAAVTGGLITGGVQLGDIKIGGGSSHEERTTEDD